MKMKTAKSVLLRGGALALCLAGGAATSVLLGQDENWDLRNYHLYNGYAALHDRLHTDLAAAGLQSWINPVLDIPYAWLALGPLSAHPVILTALMGLWYGALIAVTLGLSWTLYRFLPATLRWAATIAATLMAVTGAAVFSQVGTTFNEIPTATLVIGGLWILLQRFGADTERRTLPPLLAGALLGAAVGLKITSAIFAPAALVALLAVSRKSQCLANAIRLVLGGLGGFLIGGGWWAARLSETYGNPVFPFFNRVFRSPWYPPANFFDRRFLPHSVWEALFYPLFWISKNRMLITEIPFRDSRMAIAFVLTLLVIVVLAARTITSRAGGNHPVKAEQLPREAMFLLAFAAISYVLWIGTTAILRYAIPVEVSLTISIPLLLYLLFRLETAQKGRVQVWLFLNTLIAAMVFATARYPAWGRVPYGSRVVFADMSWVPHNALVAVVGAPTAYVVPFAPEDRHASFVGLTSVVYDARGWKLADQVADRIASHRGPIAVVWENNDAWRLPSLPDLGLETMPGTCHAFFGSYETEKDRGLNWCLARVQVHQLNARFWKEAARHYSEIEVPEPVDGWSYVGFRRAVGEAAAKKPYIDKFENLWSPRPGRPEPAHFDDKILPNTLYIINGSLRSRAANAMDKSRDLLATVDGVLVLAPGWLDVSRRQRD